MNNEELEEIFENTSFVTMMIIRDWVNKYYISKDEVLKAIGYEENEEEYERLKQDNEKLLAILDTLYSEVCRLEDIEDKKVEVAVDFIEEKRDKYWQKKIREKIKELENYQKQHKEGNWADIPIEDYDFDKINLLKELLGE